MGVMLSPKAKKKAEKEARALERRAAKKKLLLTSSLPPLPRHLSKGPRFSTNYFRNNSRLQTPQLTRLTSSIRTKFGTQNALTSAPSLHCNAQMTLVQNDIQQKKWQLFQSIDNRTPA